MCSFSRKGIIGTTGKVWTRVRSQYCFSVIFMILITVLYSSLSKVFLSLLAVLWNSAFRWYIFPFLLCFLLLFFSQLFVRPSQTTILPCCISFGGMVLVTISCTMLQTSICHSSGTLFIRSNLLDLFLTSTV